MNEEQIHEEIKDVKKPGQKIKELISKNFDSLTEQEQSKLYNKIYSKWYRGKNPGYFRKKNREWRNKNHDVMKTYMREYYQENKEELRETVKENRKKHFENNPEAKKAYQEYQRVYRLKNKKK